MRREGEEETAEPVVVVVVVQAASKVGGALPHQIMPPTEVMRGRLEGEFEETQGEGGLLNLK